ncbi:MAG: hypothetical protein HY073_02565 [Deltaproteobacteria bacterium]|nr:hypothetical protein [Deltaproteobacteria bacterium]
MSLTIHPVRSKKELKQFIKFSWMVYKNDPAWVPPLIQERLDFLNRKKNPFFEHADIELFLAKKDGLLVGRISAQIDHLHNKYHKEQTGFFGLFESINDPEVSSCLLNNAAGWLKSRGMKIIRGPFSLSINEESGMLIDGFQHAPFILTSHNPSYYPSLIEQWGGAKVKDLYCWQYDSKRPIPEAATQIADEVRKYPGLRVRQVTPKTLKNDVHILLDVFNEAWGKNWGFVPLTEKEVQKATKDFQMILEPKLALIAEVDGVPAAISLALPNLNELIKDLKGRLFPFGLLKLLYRIKTKKVRSARLMLLGIRKQFRGSILGGLSVLLYTEMHRRSQELQHWGGELSWTLEDNQKINMGISLMGGEVYKTYRIYEKVI